jgi:predicted transposase YbfD/YdcC
MVSAWGCEQRLVLAQIARIQIERDHGGAEAAGDAVTEGHDRDHRCAQLPACDCSADRRSGGDYALALKGNQGTLHDDVRLFLDDPACEAVTAEPLVEADHGRIETRTAMVSSDIGWLQKDHQWPGLAAIGKVVRIHEATDKTSTETAYYLLSKVLSAERFNEVVRQHWGVENRLHWRLAVVMNEDQDRTRLGNGPHNLAVLRHMAINAMQRDTTKGSLRGKFKRAGWDDAYLTRLLALF